MWSIDSLRQSLRGRLELNLIAGSVAILSATFVILHMLISGEIYSRLDEDIALRMRAVASYAADHPGTESIAEFMPQFRTAAHRDFFQVWDSQGRTLARSDSSAGRDLPRLAAGFGEQMYYDLALPDGHRGRAVAESFPLPAGDARGTLLVVTAEETEGLEQLENRIHAVLLLGALATIVAMLLITSQAVRRGLSPVADLVAALERVDPDDPQGRFGVGPLPTELKPVAERFSRVLNRATWPTNSARRSRRFDCWPKSAREARTRARYGPLSATSVPPPPRWSAPWSPCWR
jgi:two-component system, OmpR family, sensor histidine kinase QseC